MIGLLRDQKLVGTGIDAVANRFEEYLVEVYNNRLDEEGDATLGTQTISSRFENEIIKPIRALDSELVSLANRKMENCMRLLDDRSLGTAVAETTEVHEQILLAMREILDAMDDSETFQEAVNRLLDIRRSENRLRDEIKNRKPDEQNIFDEDDIFDDN